MADEPVLPIELIETGNLPTVVTSAGLQPTPPSVLRAQLVEIVSKTNPGFTANLPGSLVEDIVSTDTQTLVMMDQARVEAINSLTPYGCNEFVLMLLGKVYGVPIGQPVNTSVFVIFTGTPGFLIGKGFTVSDGRHQYQVQDGGILGDDGQSLPMYCISSAAGTWAVPAGTVTGLVTPPPSGYPLSVINPEPGIPATSAETATQYRSRVLRAGLAASQGMARYLRTLLSNVPGVQPRLIGIQQKPLPDGGGWMIIVGGGDPYHVAHTIYQALFDITTLAGSTIHILNITKASPALVTTDLDHGYMPGNPVTIALSNPSAYNGNFKVIATPSRRSFTIGTAFDSRQILSLAWAGGVVTMVTTAVHNVTVGSTITLANSQPTGWNLTAVVASVPNTTTLTFPLAANPGAATVLGQLMAGIANFNTSGFANYIASGTAEPNPRNMAVSITDYPDSYLIRYVLPPQQSVTATVQWGTNSPNFVSPAAIAQLAAPALSEYINSINVGAPINLLQMSDAFKDAVVSVLPSAYLSSLVFQIAINEVGTGPTAGTHIVEGDPQSFFFALPDDFTVVQL